MHGSKVDLKGREGRRQWAGLAVLTLPCVLYSMDSTVLNLAVPALSGDLRPTASQLLWILDIYGFTLAGSLIPMGALGDRIGRRRLLLVGACAFSMASVAAAFAKNAEALIASRALLGIAGATLAPSTLSLIRSMFHDARERTIALGVWVASFSVGGAIGPVLGGVLLQHFWWGSVFLISVPVMALLLVVGPIFLPEHRNLHADKIDITSAVLSLSAVLTTIYGLKGIATQGFAWSYTFCVAIGPSLGLLFVYQQARLRSPMVNLRLFGIPGFSAALVIYTLVSFVVCGSLYFVAQYMQLVIGLSPFKAGLWSVPFAVSLVVGSSVSAVATRYMSPFWIMNFGLITASIGFALLGFLRDVTTPATLSIMCCIYAFGAACVLTLSNDVMLGSVPVDEAGSASAISETASELGAALGIALLGSIGMVIYRIALGHVDALGDTARFGTLGAAVAAAHQLGGTAGDVILRESRSSFVQGFRVASVISAVALLLAAILTAFRRPRGAQLKEEIRQATLAVSKIEP
jgi:DHA2 family multidrug resistance protein-like MFS transporter